MYNQFTKLLRYKFEIYTINLLDHSMESLMLFIASKPYLFSYALLYYKSETI